MSGYDGSSFLTASSMDYRGVVDLAISTLSIIEDAAFDGAISYCGNNGTLDT
jgi:hypothetical protein